MRKNQKHNIILLLLGCCGFINMHAQKGFRNKAMLDTVPASGFYQVNLLPVVSASLQEDMRDIRIIDAASKQVPYILRSDLPAFKENKFTSLPVVSVQKEKDGQTHIVIENTLHKSLSELLLIIKNTDADRSVTLSGSDDGKTWFVIKEHIYLNNLFSDSSDRFIQSLNFPISTYHFLKIIINGKEVMPVNIVKAGVYEEALHTGKYIAVPGPVLTQKDSSNKNSYVMARFNNSYFIDRLILHIKGPKFFRRTAELYTDENNVQVLQSSFIISSDKETIIPVKLKTNKLLFKISNNDNQPLQANSITAFQLNKYLLAYLEKASTYQLLFSDSGAVVPSYDLEAFKDSIAGNAPNLQYAVIEKNILPEKKPIAKAADNKVIIWLAIGLAITILLLLTYKLTADIKNKP